MSGTVRLAAILGLLSAIGPAAIDLYLPALPSLERDLETSVAGAQTTLSVYFLAFGIAQLFYGPLADRHGRKPPIYAGLALFVVGSIGCALAPSIGWLTAMRFVQGCGGAAVMVIPRAIVRDLHTGPQATRLMATIMLVVSVSPMLAPLAGSALIAFGDWRLLFTVLAVTGLLGLLLTRSALPETLAPAQRRPIDLASLRQGARTLFGDRQFVGLTFIGGAGFASFTVFLASASFVYTGQFGLSPTGFSLAFAINALGFFGASQLAAPAAERFGVIRVVQHALVTFAIVTTSLLLLVIAGLGTLGVIIVLLFLANACMGLVIPTTMVMALDRHGDIAGLASSLGGTLQMVTGALMVGLVGPFFDGTALPMVSAIAACAAAALLLSRWLFSEQAYRPV